MDRTSRHQTWAYGDRRQIYLGLAYIAFMRNIFKMTVKKVTVLGGLPGGVKGSHGSKESTPYKSLA